MAASTTSTTTSSYFDSLLHRRQTKKMSITQTYYLAHTARKKLTREASRADHDLRLLVGHANLLDSLMFDLADAEREQERWFNQTVTGATKTSPARKSHIQWASTVVEEPEDWEEDNSDLDSDVSDSDSDDSDFDETDFVINAPRRRAPSPVAPAHEQDLLEEDEGEDTDSDFEYDEDLDELSLTRSPSRQSPPELLADSDGESEDEATPPSPPQPTLEAFDEKESAAAIAMAGSDQPHLFEQGYFGREQIIEAY